MFYPQTNKIKHSFSLYKNPCSNTKKGFLRTFAALWSSANRNLSTTPKISEAPSTPKVTTKPKQLKKVNTLNSLKLANSKVAWLWTGKKEYQKKIRGMNNLQTEMGPEGTVISPSANRHKLMSLTDKQRRTLVKSAKKNIKTQDRTKYKKRQEEPFKEGYRTMAYRGKLEPQLPKIGTILETNENLQKIQEYPEFFNYPRQSKTWVTRYRDRLMSKRGFENVRISPIPQLFKKHSAIYANPVAAPETLWIRQFTSNKGNFRIMQEKWNKKVRTQNQQLKKIISVLNDPVIQQTKSCIQEKSSDKFYYDKKFYPNTTSYLYSRLNHIKKEVPQAVFESRAIYPRFIGKSKEACSLRSWRKYSDNSATAQQFLTTEVRAFIKSWWFFFKYLRTYAFKKKSYKASETETKNKQFCFERDEINKNMCDEVAENLSRLISALNSAFSTDAETGWYTLSKITYVIFSRPIPYYFYKQATITKIDEKNEIPFSHWNRNLGVTQKNLAMFFIVIMKNFFYQAGIKYEKEQSKLPETERVAVNTIKNKRNNHVFFPASPLRGIIKFMYYNFLYATFFTKEKENNVQKQVKQQENLPNIIELNANEIKNFFTKTPKNDFSFNLNNREFRRTLFQGRDLSNLLENRLNTRGLKWHLQGEFAEKNHKKSMKLQKQNKVTEAKPGWRKNRKTEQPSTSQKLIWYNFNQFQSITNKRWRKHAYQINSKIRWLGKIKSWTTTASLWRYYPIQKLIKWQRSLKNFHEDITNNETNDNSELELPHGDWSNNGKNYTKLFHVLNFNASTKDNKHSTKANINVVKKSRTTAIMQPTLTTTIEQSSATPFTRAETSVADRRLYLMEKLFRVESVKGRLVNFIKRELFIKINPQFYRIINAKNSISPPVTFKASKNLMATHERQMRPANNFWRYYEDQRLELCEEDYSLTQFITDDENDVTSEDAKELTETQTQNPTKNDEEAWKSEEESLYGNLDKSDQFCWELVESDEDSEESTSTEENQTDIFSDVNKTTAEKTDSQEDNTGADTEKTDSQEDNTEAGIETTIEKNQKNPEETRKKEIKILAQKAEEYNSAFDWNQPETAYISVLGQQKLLNVYSDNFMKQKLPYALTKALVGLIVEINNVSSAATALFTETNSVAEARDTIITSSSRPFVGMLRDTAWSPGYRYTTTLDLPIFWSGREYHKWLWKDSELGTQPIEADQWCKFTVVPNVNHQFTHYRGINALLQLRNSIDDVTLRLIISPRRNNLFVILQPHKFQNLPGERIFQESAGQRSKFKGRIRRSSKNRQGLIQEAAFKLLRFNKKDTRYKFISVHLKAFMDTLTPKNAKPAQLKKYIQQILKPFFNKQISKRYTILKFKVVYRTQEHVTKPAFRSRKHKHAPKLRRYHF